MYEKHKTPNLLDNSEASPEAQIAVTDMLLRRDLWDTELPAMLGLVES